jgi:hypothetical protein
MSKQTSQGSALINGASSGIGAVYADRLEEPPRVSFAHSTLKDIKMKDSKSPLLDYLASVRDPERAASFFAEDGVFELPFLRSLGVEPRYAGRGEITALVHKLLELYTDFAFAAAGFQAGKTVLAPAIGGSVGNAVTQLAPALGAKHAISSTTNHAKAEQAKALGFNEVIDTSFEKLGSGVRRITGGYGADIVIDGIGWEVLSEALGALALHGRLTTLGYAADRKASIDVTNLIWKQASIKSFILFGQPQADAWNVIVPLLQSGAIKPIVAKTFPLAEAANALNTWFRAAPSAGSSSQPDRL